MTGVVDDVECTADGRPGDRPNILFTPPCSCPRCAPPPPDEADDGSAATLWLAVDGRPVRHVVAPTRLGSTGRAVLG